MYWRLFPPVLLKLIFIPAITTTIMTAKLKWSRYSIDWYQIIPGLRVEHYLGLHCTSAAGHWGALTTTFPRRPRTPELLGGNLRIRLYNIEVTSQSQFSITWTSFIAFVPCFIQIRIMTFFAYSTKFTPCFVNTECVSPCPLFAMVVTGQWYFTFGFIAKDWNSERSNRACGYFFRGTAAQKVERHKQKRLTIRFSVHVTIFPCILCSNYLGTSEMINPYST